MWIRLNTSVLDYDESTFIGVWYITPKGTTGILNTHTKWNLLTEEISNFSDKGNVLLLGDFNAHISTPHKSQGIA